MFPPGWILYVLLLTPTLTLCILDISRNDRAVTCSQDLVDCSLTNGTFLDSNSVDVTDLSARVKLCCEGDTCAYCLQLDLKVRVNKISDEEGSSGLKQDDSDETKDNEDEMCSVTVCYKTQETFPICKMVQFAVNQSRSFQQSIAQISMTVFNAKFTHENILLIESPEAPNIRSKIDVPLLAQVCRSNISHYVKECKVPKLSFLINKKQNYVELSFRDNDTSTNQVCIQNETEGDCKLWDNKPLPLDSMAPCTCFQAWKHTDPQLRSITCPFENNLTINHGPNILKNFTLTVENNIYKSITRLRWKMAAPCWLEGEVWPCKRTRGHHVCTEIETFRQQIGKDQWEKSSTGLWEKTDVFSNITLKNHPCVMLKIKGVKEEMGPYCYNSIHRWRWSVFGVAMMLLFTVALLITFCLRDFIKKSVWSWRHGGFVKIHKARVLVLSPPDSDGDVSSAVCSLGSLLCSRGFCVTVDQWSRRGQLSSGPLPWTHCQLFSVDSSCERVVLVLTPKAVNKALGWSAVDSPDLHDESPYSDVFRASLFAIQAFKNQGTATEHFVLVTFDSQWKEEKVCVNKLPEILKGLRLFMLPSQTEALLSDLCVGETQRWTKRGRWTRDYSGNKSKECDASLHSKTWETETRLLQQI
ncbi:unnamed protein product [Knipowitschia caucasica]